MPANGGLGAGGWNRSELYTQDTVKTRILHVYMSIDHFKSDDLVDTSSPEVNLTNSRVRSRDLDTEDAGTVL